MARVAYQPHSYPDRAVPHYYSPNEKRPYFSNCSPTNDAFAHAVAAGIMTRTSLTQELAGNDTQYFEYIGDENSYRPALKRSVIAHHFIHVNTRQRVIADAPVGYIPPDAANKRMFKPKTGYEPGKILRS